jgi:hypothetical protein
MKWIDRAEARFGHLAIPGLLRWVALVNVLVFIAHKLYAPTFALLDLHAGLVLRGEVWRLVTYIFIPEICSMIPLPDWFNAAVFVMFMWWVGDGLDTAWGPFRTNLFYLLGMVGTTIAAFFFGAALSNIVLNTSVFFAFARFYGDQIIYLFFILPVKVKWAAGFAAAGLLLNFVPQGLEAQSALAAALANYLVFFGPQILGDARQRHDVAARRRRFESAKSAGAHEALHRCEVCGRTELSEPHLDFRVARNGNEYCVEHLPKAMGAGEVQ